VQRASGRDRKGPGWGEEDILVHDGFHLLVRADRVDVHVLTKLLFLGVAHVVEDLRDTQEVKV
jgi:hypothetical protein